MTDIHELRANNWSEHNIAMTIGTTRPAIHAFIVDGKDTLTLEQKAKLEVLVNLNMDYNQFKLEAIRQFIWEKVAKPAYARLATDGGDK